jgi:RNA polymerase sigma-70 factor (ECF subfamily)
MEREAGLQLDDLAALFDGFHERLWTLARRLVGDPDEAKDLVQEVFLRAARNAAKVPRATTEAEAWLVHTLVNLCRDRGRRRKVQQKAREALASVNRETSDPESAVVARATVVAALATLPARQRAVLVLHDLEERDPGEIARMLGVAPVTVRWHLAAARRAMRRRLEITEGAGR